MKNQIYALKFNVNWTHTFLISAASAKEARVQFKVPFEYFDITPGSETRAHNGYPNCKTNWIWGKLKSKIIKTSKVSKSKI